MQHHFVRSASRDDVLEHTWSELDAVANRWLPNLRGLGAALQESRTADLQRYEQVLAWMDSSGEGGGVIVDRGWNVLLIPTSPQQPKPIASVGAQVRWTAAQGTGDGGLDYQRGTLETADGPHLAVARPVPDGEGYLVVHEPRAAIDARLAATLSSLPGISALTGIWTGALLGIATFMVLARFHDDAERERTRTVGDQLQQRQKLLRTRDAVIFGLAKLADSRDPETGDHLERISVYSTMLASVLRTHPKYAKEVSPAFVRLIGISSALHDIGKVGIEDRILLKPGPLTPDERQRIQEHAAIGGDCLREIEQRLGSSNFLQMAREIAFAHHERWDGGGYPQGLKGEEIPLPARIVAIVDVYDALSSRRVYKGPRKHEECVEIIRKAAGTQFDPDLVAVWLAIENRFREIGERYADRPTERRKTEAPAIPAAQEAEFPGAAEKLITAEAGQGA